MILRIRVGDLYGSNACCCNKVLIIITYGNATNNTKKKKTKIQRAFYSVCHDVIIIV